MSHTATSKEASVAPRYLEDFAVGDRAETGRTIVTREMIEAFAELYDPQPMHLDETAAQGTVFGRLIGSGWQTLALTMRLMVDARFLGSTPIVGAEFKEMRFHAPMLPGDTLQANAEILAVRPSKSRPDRGFMDVRVTTKNAAGETRTRRRRRRARVPLIPVAFRS
ncbi:MAG: MaoC family dehydratase [Rhodospirillaceae bacterium]